MPRIRWPMFSKSILTSGVRGAAGLGSGFGSSAFGGSALFSSSLSGANGDGRSLARTVEVDAAGHRPAEAADVRLQRRPESVEAVKYRYLPSLSNTGSLASLMPSVTCVALPRERIDVDRAEIVRQPRRIRQPLGVRRPDGNPVVAKLLQYGSLSTRTGLRCSTSMYQIRMCESTNAIFFESGTSPANDRSPARASRSSSRRRSRFAARGAARIRRIRRRSRRSSCRPATRPGIASMTPGVFVMFRGSPFSAGTVRISPRASNSARVAFGDRCAFESRALTFTIRARTSGKSPAMRTGTGFGLPVFRSNRSSPPNCSTTIAPAGRRAT